MMTWAQIILSTLRLIEWLIEMGQKHKWIQEGESRAIARGLAEVVRKQEYARETLKSIERLSDAELDDLLRTLAGPGQPDSK